MPISSRRVRTRAPTCTSTGAGTPVPRPYRGTSRWLADFFNVSVRLGWCAYHRPAPGASPATTTTGGVFESRRLFRPGGLTSKRLGEVEQAAAHGRIVDRVIGLDQFDRLAPAQRIGLEGLRRRLGKACRDRRRAYRIGVVEKERHRHIQHLAQLIEPAGADAVGAAFVFLHLLKGQADRLAELLLREAEHVAAQPNPGPDLDVDRVRF